MHACSEDSLSRSRHCPLHLHLLLCDVAFPRASTPYEWRSRTRSCSPAGPVATSSPGAVLCGTAYLFPHTTRHKHTDTRHPCLSLPAIIPANCRSIRGVDHRGGTGATQTNRQSLTHLSLRDSRARLDARVAEWIRSVDTARGPMVEAGHENLNSCTPQTPDWHNPSYAVLGRNVAMWLTPCSRPP